MLIDGRELPKSHGLGTDICIVGAGPAGLTLASELCGSGLDVVVLESGPAGDEPDGAELGRGQTVGDPYHALDQARARGIGGTARIWDSRVLGEELGFRAAPLDEIDFEKRDWLPNSGWPYARETLDPYYERANALCGFGPFRYDAAAWADDNAPLPELPPEVILGAYMLASRDVFQPGLRQRLEAAPDVRVVVHSTAVELEHDESGTHVQAVRATGAHGRTLRVRARATVLAAGGIENPRLLLASNAHAHDGLGNANGLVGRFFMEHPYVHFALLFPRDRGFFERAALLDVRRVSSATVTARIGFTDAFKRRERLLNWTGQVMPHHHAYDPEAMEELKALLREAAGLRVPADLVRRMRRVGRGRDYIAIAIARKLFGKHRFPHVVEGPRDIDGPDPATGANWSALDKKSDRWTALYMPALMEQTPDPDNRVTLSSERDALGVPIPRLEWRWRAADREHVLRNQQQFARAAAASGFGKVRVFRDGDGPDLRLPGLHHHLGTTRMHDDPKQGVVDAHGRVHGVQNLFVTGGSTFTTGGCINPTLTMIALAIKLADRLKVAVPAHRGPRHGVAAGPGGS